MKEQVPKTIYYPELQPLPKDHPLASARNAYLREAPRVLAEGHEGQFLLIKDEQVIGLFDNWETAINTGHECFHDEAFLVQEIRAEKRLLRIRGYNWPMPLRITVPYTELRPLPEHDPRAKNWNAYLREAPRLLAEGHEGRCVILRDGKIIGIYHNRGDARTAGIEIFPDQLFLVHQIQSQEPISSLRGQPLLWPV